MSPANKREKERLKNWGKFVTFVLLVEICLRGIIGINICTGKDVVRQERFSVVAESKFSARERFSSCLLMHSSKSKRGGFTLQPETMAEDSAQIRRAKNPTSAMLRSLAFPGWGQLYNGKWFKAGLVFVAETGLVINALYWDYQAQKATSSWYRDFYRDNRNLSFWWLAAAVLLSIGDAYVDAHLSTFDISTNLSADAWTVGVKCRLAWGR